MIIIKAGFSGGSLGKNEGCENAPDAVVKELNQCFLSENLTQTKPEIKGLKLNSSNIEASFFAIEEFVGAQDQKFIMIGGDHSITYPAFKGFSRVHPGVGLLVLDAHADAVNVFEPPTHEDFIRTLIEKQIVPPERIMLVGLRNIHKIELDFLRSRNVRFLTMKHCYDVGIKQLTTALMESCSQFSSLYLSIDIDVLDPAFAPGTGYPEPGGFSSRELIHMLQRITLMKNLKGIDLVEINPQKDVGGRTLRLGARIIREIL